MSGAHWCLVYHLGISGPGLQLPGKARKSWYAVPIFMKKLVRIMCILLETRDGVGMDGSGEKRIGGEVGGWVAWDREGKKWVIVGLNQLNYLGI